MVVVVFIDVGRVERLRKVNSFVAIPVAAIVGIIISITFVVSIAITMIVVVGLAMMV